MGRIRRTIIMGNPRGFVLKKFALIIATWAVVSVLVIGANHCQQVKIVTDGRLVSDRETTFATLRVDIEEPSWDQEEGNELFHNYQFWIASDNKDLVRFFQKEGGATDRQAVHVEDMVFSLSPNDGTFFFDAPKPTPSPSRLKTLVPAP